MELKDKLILVTGGAGFIGSHIADRLLNIGANVRILDNLLTGDLSNIDLDRVEFIQGDIRDDNAVKKALQGVDIVFHEAAQINPAKAVEDPAFDFDINVRGTLNMLLKAKDAGVKKFIMASTNVYGDADVEVMTEDYSTLYAERSLLSPYAAAKVSAEAYLKVFNDEIELPTVRLRYTNVYGPRQLIKSESGAVAIFSIAALNRQTIRIFGDGNQTRDFVYVSDVVDANINAAASEKANGRVFNVGTGIETSINQLAREIIAVTDDSIKVEHVAQRAADFRRVKADLTLAREILNFNPQIKLDEGLKRYITWLRQKRMSS